MVYFLSGGSRILICDCKKDLSIAKLAKFDLLIGFNDLVTCFFSQKGVRLTKTLMLSYVFQKEY